MNLGKRHEEVADVRNSLGLLDKRQARYSDAERQFRAAMNIAKAVFNDEHSKVGLYLANIGDIQRKRKDNLKVIDFCLNFY